MCQRQHAAATFKTSGFVISVLNVGRHNAMAEYLQHESLNRTNGFLPKRPAALNDST